MSTHDTQTNGDRKRKNNKNRTRLLIVIIIILTVMITGAGLGFLTASIHTMPSLKGDLRPDASSQIFDINGKLISTIHSVENRIPVPLSKTPKHLQDAFISAEDVRFYQHMGIDPRGILRAIWSNISDGSVSEGASTITQQLARNALLSHERSLKRKIQEAFLAIEIERKYTKPEILEMYMNQVYFGQGAYGVQAASNIYFGKSVSDLTLEEAAMIAGLPQSPNYYSPINNLKAAKERQHIVLDQMLKYGYINAEAANNAKNKSIKIVSKSSSQGTASYFIDYVVQHLIDKYGADAVYKDGLKIYTTMDLSMQKAAEQAINHLPTYYTDKSGLKQPQGALVAIDPHNGHIKAMVGGRGNDQFNRAVLAERQPGSAFKPFVYLAAIESGMTPATIVEDKALTFGSWSPQNYDRKFQGKITLRSALEQSLNSVAVGLAHQVGIDKVLYYAQQTGISTLVFKGDVNDRNLASSLGGLTRGVTPLEIASAFGVFANQGIKVEPISIIKVVDRNGKVIEQTNTREKIVVNEKSAYLLTDMLKSVITNGTGGGANIGRPAAGKTGTTDDYSDAWFVGYTPDLVAAVWMGNDTTEKLHGITGGTTPATIWRTFMLSAMEKYPVRDFVRPAGIVSAVVSTKDGLLVKDPTKVLADPNNKDVRTELFIDGTQPNKFSDEKSKDKDSKDAVNKDSVDSKKNTKNLKDDKDSKSDVPAVVPSTKSPPNKEKHKSNTPSNPDASSNN